MDSKSKLGARVDGYRISQLPDELIYHILSFLPTVDSVRTTFLSTRWRSNLWTFVNTFDIDHQRDFADMPYNDFANFVSGALSVHGLSNIKNFRLSCHGILAIKEGLFRICYDLPTSGCFSSLRSLYLGVVDHDYTDIEKLINKCCPVLEELELGGSIRIPGNRSHFNISALKLKRLTMDFYFNDAYYFLYALINATKLENLYVKGIKLNFILENPKSLDKAEIDLSPTLIINRINLGHKMTNLLAGLSGVKDLYIRSDTFETCRVPVFDNLKKLELILDAYGELVTKFLKRSPNLEHLILELDNK